MDGSFRGYLRGNGVGFRVSTESVFVARVRDVTSMGTAIRIGDIYDVSRSFRHGITCCPICVSFGVDIFFGVDFSITLNMSVISDMSLTSDVGVIPGKSVISNAGFTRGVGVHDRNGIFVRRYEADFERW